MAAMDLLSDLQVQYTEKQKRIKRLSEIFMGSLGTLQWQIVYARKRIEVAEERLWRERAAGVPENPSPVPPPPPPTHQPQSLPTHTTSPLCSHLPIPVSPSLPLLLTEDTSRSARSHPIPDVSTDLSTIVVQPQETPSTTSEEEEVIISSVFFNDFPGQYTEHQETPSTTSASSVSAEAMAAMDLLSDLQVQYTEKQKRIKRLSEIFMGSLGTLSCCCSPATGIERHPNDIPMQIIRAGKAV
ncbi:uncharacterized protein LOC128337550 isoform X2 [Hemicordylus capensis]|uniref:uncharacterized protein LOC128337550 isoform X2 n=1 Tax=Hemicordylus capensis TaxID=884348 RepID=UPI002303C769|nr:uncharacterized protein LOC128337550 isoform X2 [Hemicordylus capensis]